MLVKKARASKILKLNATLVFVFCLFMYPPTFSHASLLMQIIIYGVSILYLILNWQLFIDICKKQRKLIFFALILLVLSLVIPLVNKTGDFSYLLSVTGYLFRKGIVYLFLLCLLYKKYGGDRLLYYFLYYFAITHFIYVLGTLLLVFIPTFQNFWFGIFDKEAADALTRSAGYTFRLGWQGFAGFRLTLYCTISIIFLLYLRYGTRIKVISVMQFIVPFLACLIGNMFYGRVGLVLTILVGAIAIVFWNRRHIGRIVFFAGLIVGIVLSVSSLRDIPTFNSWYNWMSKPIINLVTYGEFDDSSFDRLQEMNQVEISADTLIFGDGRYRENGHYYMNTDAGFVRNILFWGIFGGILSYGFTLYSIIGLRKISKMMMLQLLITFLAFEYKGAVYYEFIPLAFVIMAAFRMPNFVEQRNSVNSYLPDSERGEK